MSEFVSFQIAKNLKEKGYPQLKKGTFAMYNEEGEWFSLSRNLDEFEYCFDDFDEHDFVAPTISQVLKWLREEKGIHITICVCGEGWFYEVINISSGKSLVEDYEDDMIQSYEEATLTGIKYVLNNVIQL